jgi:hypothetical protein
MTWKQMSKILVLSSISLRMYPHSEIKTSVISNVISYYSLPDFGIRLRFPGNRVGHFVDAGGGRLTGAAEVDLGGGEGLHRPRPGAGSGRRRGATHALAPRAGVTSRPRHLRHALRHLVVLLHAVDGSALLHPRRVGVGHCCERSCVGDALFAAVGLDAGGGAAGRSPSHGRLKWGNRGTRRREFKVPPLFALRAAILSLAYRPGGKWTPTGLLQTGR